MKSIACCVVTKLEILDNELVAIHALEIINNFITGIYFHAYLKKDVRKYHDMYYLAEYSYCLEKKEKLQKFLNFIENSIIVGHNINYDIRYINK